MKTMIVARVWLSGWVVFVMGGLWLLTGCMAALPGEPSGQPSAPLADMPVATATMAEGGIPAQTPPGEASPLQSTPLAPTEAAGVLEPSQLAVEAPTAPAASATSVPEPTLPPTAPPPDAPEPAPQGDTALPTAAPGDIITAPTLPALSNEERWRAQQVDREPFGATRTYMTNGSELWWYDPVQQQHVILGTFSGPFEAQARFTLRGQGVPALEVPYQVNNRYGLTSLSPALVQRIADAGYGEWIETYVIDGPGVQPR
jgi:hypothetical protein